MVDPALMLLRNKKMDALKAREYRESIEGVQRDR
jgi:hypothetical protein